MKLPTEAWFKCTFKVVTKNRRNCKIDGRLQYGMNDGVFFLVFHDKSQTPYQRRFIQSHMQKQLDMANAWLKAYTGGKTDLSWIAGEYLRNF